MGTDLRSGQPEHADVGVAHREANDECLTGFGLALKQRMHRIAFQVVNNCN